METARSHRGIFIFIFIALVLGIGTIIMLNNQPKANEEHGEEDLANKRRVEIQALMEQWELEQRSLVDGKSSNPFDYARTPAFQKLSELDAEYLPFLVERVEQEETFSTFALTAAVTRVSKSKEVQSFMYGTRNDYLRQWKEFHKSVPNKYKTIKDKKEVTPEVVQEVVDLGVLALPLIIEDIESNDDVGFSPAIKRILQDEALPADNDLKSWKTWTKNNRDKYKGLKMDS